MGALSTETAAVERYFKTIVPSTAIDASPDQNALATLLVVIRRLQRAAKDAEQFVEDELVNAMSTREWDVPGVGRIVMHSGAKRTEWQHDALTDAIVQRFSDELPPTLVDPDTGETLTAHEVVRKVVALTFSCRAGSTWKVRGLQAKHIDPGDYCQTSWGRKTIETPSE